MGSGHSGVGTKEKQGVFCHARGEKDEILYRGEDPGQERRNDGESGHRRAFQVPERSGKDDHLRPRERVRLLERDRESAALRYVFRRSVLRMAKRDERKPERTAAGVLPERQESFAGQSRDPEKEPGVDQRQAQESFAFTNTTRFVPRKSHKVLHLF